MPAQPHLLHVFPTFAHGGVPIRISTIINHFGDRYRHTVLSLDGPTDCRSRLKPGIPAKVEAYDGPSTGLPGRLRAIRRYIKSQAPDLLLTFNWGATEWALANTLSPICRHVHLESGFGVEEAERQIPRRVYFRRLALARASQIVVPSFTLVRIASDIWKLPRRKITHIPNGVDCVTFSRAPVEGIPPGFEKRPGELILGTVAPLRAEKNIARLLQVFAQLPESHATRLLLIGDGDQRPHLEALAAELGVADRVVFAGHCEEIDKLLGWIDIFVMTSDTEQMPNSILQAMASGRAIASFDVGDVKAMLPDANKDFVTPKESDVALRRSLETLLGDTAVREQSGAANRAQAEEVYAAERMFAAYEKVFDA
ncbi:glycosyltransferase family 4 protein [Denitrobaculum tricleocarpae]|uniref:Glycosyltransferase family 4 protein n=1 Tax=Denitrobaculum tricleocarpae TaxID=2591009 RepID=A0A545TG88_9PROT|nr:glycosyltransferase family 4 protein [Denitrobaculum tricleocarpae]TQV76242.1 glycosyltransferase family 4 protein [Denitrobaculum tricleocarpae]